MIFLSDKRKYGNKTAGKYLAAERMKVIMELEELRKKLDAIDAQLTALTEQRLNICEQVAEYKILHGRPVLDAERERQKIQSVRALVTDERYQDAVEHLFTQIMADSRALQTELMKGKQSE
ncbi:MAG: chorismate mutase [bacterium]|nr:chorismate mutase [bacterium]